MNNLAIVVFSCDKNEECWPLFIHCLDKYWSNHPKVYLLTETKKDDNFISITKNYKLDHWTKRIRESLEEIKESHILFICDDCFLNKEINQNKLEKALTLLERDNTANVNLELLPDFSTIPAEIEGFTKKTNNSTYKVSLLCGLWNKDKLINILKIKDCNPWEVEKDNNDLGYDYYITEKDKILSWYRDGPGDNAAIRQGKWMHGIEVFAKKEKVKVDFNKKGFWTQGYWEKYIRLLSKIEKLDKEIKEKQEEHDKYEKAFYNLIEEEKKK